MYCTNDNMNTLMLHISLCGWMLLCRAVVVMLDIVVDCIAVCDDYGCNRDECEHIQLLVIIFSVWMCPSWERYFESKIGAVRSLCVDLCIKAVFFCVCDEVINLCVAHLNGEFLGL